MLIVMVMFVFWFVMMFGFFLLIREMFREELGR